MTPGEITDIQIQSLEQVDGTLAVTFCDPQQIFTQSAYLETGKTVAAPVAGTISEHLFQSLHWQVIKRLDSSYGCLFVYRYTSASLTDAEKWQKLVESPTSREVLPGVWLYDYRSRYNPEYIKGEYYQWLPGGPDGLRVILFSNQARPVIFEATANAGPARQDNVRTLLIDHDGQALEYRIEGIQDIKVPLELQPGVNTLGLSIREAADSSTEAPVSGRELMLLLSQLRFSSN